MKKALIILVAVIAAAVAVIFAIVRSGTSGEGESGAGKRPSVRIQPASPSPAAHQVEAPAEAPSHSAENPLPPGRRLKIARARAYFKEKERRQKELEAIKREELPDELRYRNRKRLSEAVEKSISESEEREIRDQMEKDHPELKERRLKLEAEEAEMRKLLDEKRHRREPENLHK